MYRVSPFVRHFAWSLLSGAALATLWVNLSPASYYDAIEWRLFDLPIPHFLSPFPISLTPLAIVSNGLMSLFLFFVGKELWEALILQRGALSGRQAAVPTAAVVGGMIGAIAAWLITGAVLETAAEATPGIGWSVPLGSDVVLCYVIGRRVFGPAHPALHILLLITIGNDILGLLIAGIFEPMTDLRFAWLALPLGASVSSWVIWGRKPRPDAPERVRRRSLAIWPYICAGVVSYIGTVAAGLPGALGLLPVIPAIPHADRAFGLFAEAEELLHDPLNRLAHLLVRPLAIVLFLFGLTRGGVDLGAYAPTTATTLVALWLGKPIGMLVAIFIASRWFPWPAGLRTADFCLISVICGMGFTVPLLAIDQSLPGGGMAEAARLGLAISLGAGLLALVLARILQDQTGRNHR